MDTDKEEKERIIKDKVVSPTGGGEVANLEIWNIYMHLYGHGLWKKRTTHTFTILEGSK